MKFKAHLARRICQAATNGAKFALAFCACFFSLRYANLAEIYAFHIYDIHSVEFYIIKGFAAKHLFDVTFVHIAL